MKFLLNELNKIIDLSGKSKNDLIDIFTALAFEVEDVFPASQISGVRLAKTFGKISHPNANKLSVLKTEIDGKKIDVVCGGINIDSNQIVAHAIPGSIVGEMTMAPKELRGVMSNGMILSISEIMGLDKNIIEDSENGKILVFPENTNLNQDINTLLEIDKDVIELDILPDRQYAANYFFMAREIAAYLDIDYNLEINELESKEKTNVEIELGENANAIFTAEAKINQIDTPLMIKRVLYHSGIKPQNNISDLSAYVMLMTGSVTYIIDKQHNLKLNDRKLNNIDLFNSSAKLTDANEVLLVNVSSNKQSNFMSEKNLDVVFGSRQIRGINVESAELSLKLFLSLAKEFGYLETSKKIVFKVNEKNNEYQIEPEYIFNYLGEEIDLGSIKSKLIKLGFGIDENKYVIPPYRTDIKFKADVIEEIARFYGISKISPKPYKITNEKINVEPHKDSLIKITDELIKYGLYEIKTYQLATQEEAKKYNIWNISKFIQLREDYSFEYNTLQTSLLSGLIDSFKSNHRNDIFDIRMFELSNVFHNEKPVYSLGILHNEEINVGEPILATKELILKSIESIGVDINKISFESTKKNKIFNPFISSNILFNGEVIGIIGEIHPSILREHKFIRLDKVKTKLYYGELQLEKLF